MSAAAPTFIESPKVSASRWSEICLPSFSDIIFIAVIVWTFMANDLGWSGLLTDGDSGWHLRTGQWILAHHQVPYTDLFSFSKAGQPWFAWEWLTDVLYALLYSWMGLKGIVLISGLVISATATVLCRHMVWRGANPLVALPLALVGLSASSLHFHARPHVFTLLFLAIGMWMLDADRRNPSRKLYLLVPLMVLWTNLHGGFPLFIAILALLVAGCALRAVFGFESWEATRRYALLGVLCAGATLVNPYGWQLHVHIAGYLRSDWIQSAVQEFQAPTFRGEGMMHYQFLLFAGLAAVALLLRRGQFPEALWLLFLGHESLNAARHIPLYSIVVTPLLATELTSLWREWADRQSKGSLSRLFWKLGEDIAPQFRRTSLWSGAWVLALLALGAPFIQWPANYPSLRFPVSMVDRYGSVLEQSRLFTNDQWADYLLYHSYPRQKVFIDGRSDFFGEKLGKEYLALSGAQADWRKILARHDFDAVLAPTDWALATILKDQPEWRLVAEDKQSLLFVRRDRHDLPVAAARPELSNSPLLR